MAGVAPWPLAPLPPPVAIGAAIVLLVVMLATLIEE